MRRINKKLGIALAIICVISCVANYFNVLATPVLIASFVLSTIIAFLAMVQTYHHEDWHPDNPSTFWLTYSAVSGVILIGVFYGTGFKVINQQISISLLSGLCPMMFPIIGAFIGSCWKSLIKYEPTKI